jgi:hypothetical protein
MEIWALWVDSIGSVIAALASGAGLGLGEAIIVGTLLLRTALLPLASLAHCSCCLHAVVRRRIRAGSVRI